MKYMILSGASLQFRNIITDLTDKIDTIRMIPYCHYDSGRIWHGRCSVQDMIQSTVKALMENINDHINLIFSLEKNLCLKVHKKQCAVSNLECNTSNLDDLLINASKTIFVAMR